MTGVLVFSLLAVCSIGILAFYSISHQIFRFPSGDSFGAVSLFYFAAPYSFPAVLISICFLTVSVPVITGLMMAHFAKTQSQECLYFALFLLACLTESIRLFIPFLGLWKSNASFLITSTRIFFFGRLLAPASFLFSSIFSIVGQTQGSERNSGVLFAVTGVIALLIPVNTTRILPNCTVGIGFIPFFWVYELTLAVLTFVSLLLEAQNNGPERKRLAMGFLLLFTGYILLIQTLSMFSLALGIIFFASGVYLYLVNLHQTYL
jgi:hypothetical protein